MSERIKVAIRCWPLSEQENQDSQKTIVKVDSNQGEILIQNSDKQQTKQFTFDHVYDSDSSQKDIYEDCAYGIIESVFEGYNGTIFAYGQTGTGKTYTMEGGNDQEHEGIIPWAFKHIFEIIHSSENKQFIVSCSMLELYNEQVYDLLDTRLDKLDLHEKLEEGFYVKDLSIVNSSSVDSCMQFLKQGSLSRKKAETQMNKESSWSHCIFTLLIESSVIDSNGQTLIRKGKLNLVDLAGSERQKKTQAVGSQMKEAQKINFSLVCLGKVISALVKDDSKFIPYRDSKLTKLLMNSLGGNSKTVMIANIGPAFKNYEESLCTLWYANQAKNIKNKPKINEDPKDTQLKKLQSEIEELKLRLQQAKGVIQIENLEQFTGEMKAEMIQQFQKDQENSEELYWKQKDKVLQMQKITEKQRKELLDEIQKNELIEKQKNQEKKQLFQQIQEIQKKIIKGDKDQEEFHLLQKELHQKWIENQQIEQEQQQLKRLQEEVEIDKINLENKFKSQQEEYQELLSAHDKIEKWYTQLRGQYLEHQENRNQEINQLKEELKEKQIVYQKNQKILEKYFSASDITLLFQNLQINSYQDSFQFDCNKNPKLVHLIKKFQKLKEISDADYSQINSEQENILLFGNKNPYYQFIR